MELDLGKGLINMGGTTTDNFYIYAIIICAVVLLVGVVNFFWLRYMKKQMAYQFIMLNEKIDSITKTLKDVE